MSTQGIEQLLSQMRAASALASGSAAASSATEGGTDFAELLKASINQVNGAQKAAGDMAKEFELGAPDASLHEVMLSLQKANLSFQTMVQVRNKLVTAYQEVMNMPV